MIEFNPNTHEYIVDDRRVPYSVTEILPKKKIYCDLGNYYDAIQEGKENHDLIRMYYDTGDTFGDQYLIDYDEMIAKNIDVLGELICYETPLYSSTYDFAGKPDVIYSNAIIDIKRNYERRITALQLAGYALLVEENDLSRGIPNWFIAWHNGNKFRIKNIYDKEALKCFVTLRKEKDLRLIIDDYMSKSYKDVSKIYE